MTMAPSIEQRHDVTATFLLLTSLPDDFRGLWHTSKEVTRYLKDGGIAGMDHKTVLKALRSDRVVFERNTYRNTTYFRLGEPVHEDFSPKQQKEQECNIMGYMPQMVRSFFKNHSDMKDAVKILEKHFAPHPNPSVRTRSATTAASTTTSTETNGAFCQTVGTNVPEGLTNLRTGFVQQDIDMDHAWTNMVLQHGKKHLKYGQTDTWYVIQDLVSGMKSDSEFTTKVLLELGGIDTEVRQRILHQLTKHKALQQASKEQLDNQVRRRMSHKLKLTQMEKEDDKRSAHKSDKLPPTDDCKSTKRETRKRKGRACSKCKDFGYFITERYGELFCLHIE